MKSDYLCILLVVLASLWATGEGRGGRGRGGGSFGGLFGSFRKYKKLSSTGTGRRTVNGSPMQTVATKPVLKPAATSHVKPPPSSGYSAAKPAPPPSYAQSMSHSSYNNYYGSPAGAAHIPPGGSYYGNAAAMPPGAIYYAQPPMQSSSGTGNFLFGMMAGHVMGSMMRGPHVHHATNVYRQDGPPANADGRKVIIIENGNATDATAANLWPTDSVVPLAEFNATITPPDVLETGNKTIFPKRANTPVDGGQTSATTPPDHQSNLDASSTAAQESSTVPPPLPAGGIICVPVLLNVTDPSDAEQRVQQVEKVLCYPAPPPPPPTVAATNCADPSSSSAAAADGSSAADCLDNGDANQLSTIEPPQIAGEIPNDSDEQQRVN